jgi:hypothetical protein
MDIDELRDEDVYNYSPIKKKYNQTKSNYVNNKSVPMQNNYGANDNYVHQGQITSTATATSPSITVDFLKELEERISSRFEKKMESTNKAIDEIKELKSLLSQYASKETANSK